MCDGDADTDDDDDDDDDEMTMIPAASWFLLLQSMTPGYPLKSYKRMGPISSDSTL